MVEKEGAARVTCYVKDKAYVPHSMVKAPWSQCLVASGFVFFKYFWQKSEAPVAEWKFVRQSIRRNGVSWCELQFLLETTK